MNVARVFPTAAIVCSLECRIFQSLTSSEHDFIKKMVPSSNKLSYIFVGRLLELLR